MMLNLFANHNPNNRIETLCYVTNHFLYPLLLEVIKNKTIVLIVLLFI